MPHIAYVHKTHAIYFAKKVQQYMANYIYSPLQRPAHRFILMEQIQVSQAGALYHPHGASDVYSVTCLMLR